MSATSLIAWRRRPQVCSETRGAGATIGKLTEAWTAICLTHRTLGGIRWVCELWLIMKNLSGRQAFTLVFATRLHSVIAVYTGSPMSDFLVVVRRSPTSAPERMDIFPTHYKKQTGPWKLLGDMSDRMSVWITSKEASWILDRPIFIVSSSCCQVGRS